MSIKIVKFNPNLSPQRDHHFRKMQYDLFVSEQGWNLPSQERKGITLPAEGDRFAVNLVMYNNSQAIGCCRVFSHLDQNFPQENIFDKLLDYREDLYDHCSLIAGLGIIPEYRGRCGREKIDDRRKSIPRRLIYAAVEESKRQGKGISLLATGTAQMASLSHKLGFISFGFKEGNYGPFEGLLLMAKIDENLDKPSIVKYIKDSSTKMERKEKDTKKIIKLRPSEAIAQRSV